MTIVKVQVPIFSSEPNAPALVYDEAKRHYVLQQLDNAPAVMGHDYKAFFEAEWDGNQWKLGRRTGHQDW